MRPRPSPRSTGATRSPNECPRRRALPSPPYPTSPEQVVVAVTDLERVSLDGLGVAAWKRVLDGQRHRLARAGPFRVDAEDGRRRPDVAPPAGLGRAVLSTGCEDCGRADETGAGRPEDVASIELSGVPREVVTFDDTVEKRAATASVRVQFGGSSLTLPTAATRPGQSPGRPLTSH